MTDRKVKLAVPNVSKTLRVRGNAASDHGRDLGRDWGFVLQRIRTEMWDLIRNTPANTAAAAREKGI